MPEYHFPPVFRASYLSYQFTARASSFMHIICLLPSPTRSFGGSRRQGGSDDLPSTGDSGREQYQRAVRFRRGGVRLHVRPSLTSVLVEEVGAEVRPSPYWTN